VLCFPDFPSSGPALREIGDVDPLVRVEVVESPLSVRAVLRPGFLNENSLELVRTFFSGEDGAREFAGGGGGIGVICGPIGLRGVPAAGVGA